MEGGEAGSVPQTRKRIAMKRQIKSEFTDVGTGQTKPRGMGWDKTPIMETLLDVVLATDAWGHDGGNKTFLAVTVRVVSGV